MPQLVSAGTDLAKKIIELSDQVSEHSKKLTVNGFVLTNEYAEETRRLTELCKLLKEEADQLHEGHKNI
jgi:hypothetical protein